MRVKLAASVLEAAIERYRKRNQGPVLSRASAIFKCLTDESFDSLDVALDDKDVPIVIGVRPSGSTVTVEGMSNGTRDQLFLALRVAAIERYVAANEPMPFIADDLLVDFDDKRAAAALRVLSGLSDRLQVLFLTHHSHIVDLAGKVLDPKRFRVQVVDYRRGAHIAALPGFEVHQGGQGAMG